MTTKTEAAARAAAPASFTDQIWRMWLDSVAWVSNHSLQIVIGSAIAVVIVLLLMGAKAFGLRLCRSDPTHNHWRTTVGSALSRTKLWFMIAVAAQTVSRYAYPPDFVEATIKALFTVAVALQVAIWTRIVIIAVIEHRAGGDEASGGLGNAIGIVRLLINVVIFAIAILVILDNLGVNVTGLVAGLGIGGIAIGLAAKGIFDDLFSALSIIFDKPFRRGDSVRWDQTSGTVESIGLKSTRVRAVTGEEVVISNTNLLNKELHNLARLARRRMILTIGVIYQTRPDVCAAIPDIVREVVEAHDKCRLVRAGMTGFGASSLDFEVQFDIHSEVYDEIFEARGAVCIALLKRFNAEGIEFAYPTQTTFTAAPDGTMIMPYAADRADEQERPAAADGDRGRTATA